MLDDLGRRVQVDETLVDTHLEVVPSLGALTTRRLTGGVSQNLGGETNGTLNTQLLVLGSVNKVSADYRTTIYKSNLVSKVIRKRKVLDVGGGGCLPFSRFFTLREVRVIRILWILAAGAEASTSLSLAT